MNSSAASHAANLNNEGVSFLNSGDYESAIAALSSGLAFVKQILLELDEDDDAVEFDCVVPSCVLLKLQSQLPQTTAGNYVFQDALYIQPEASFTSVKYFVTQSYIMIYNQALSHHLSALNDTTSLALYKLKKAVSLYELAYSMQETEDLDAGILTSMAIMNNLAQIHASLNNTVKCEQCYRHLLSTIMYVKDVVGEDAVQELEGFIGNVMPLIVDSSSAPAA